MGPGTYCKVKLMIKLGAIEQENLADEAQNYELFFLIFDDVKFF